MGRLKNRIPCSLIPSFVFELRGLDSCKALLPFGWSRLWDDELYLVEADSSGTISLENYIHALKDGDLDSFKSLLRALAACLRAIKELEDWFIVSEMLSFDPAKIFLSENLKHGHPHLRAAFVFGEGIDQYRGLLGLLDAASHSMPQSAGIIRMRLEERFRKASPSIADLIGFLSLWILEL